MTTLEVKRLEIPASQPTHRSGPGGRPGRRILTIAVAVTITIAAAWSIINIADVARHYHDTAGAWLIGLAFGAANAISVYAFATSPAGSAARRPAIVGTVVFGFGSAAIQFHLYSTIEGVAIGAAFWFGVLGPAAEAILAWLEASLNLDHAADEAHQAQQEAAQAAERQQLAQAQQEAQQARQEAQSLRRQLEQAAEAAARHREPAPDPAAVATSGTPAPAAMADEFTPEQIEQIEQIRQIVAGQRIDKAADIMEPLAITSERSAQRLMSQAKQAGAIRKNGNGYEPTSTWSA